MEHNQSNDGSQGAIPGGNIPPYQAAYQGPPTWFPQGLPQLATNVSMMHPSTNGPQPYHPAENANASALPDEEEAEEPVSPPPTGKGKRTKMVRTKLSNFNPDEDVNLVKAWLEICCDPITNAGQKKHGMWLRIQQRYNFRRGSYPERSVKSLQSRWDIIKTKVGKFSSFYADAIQENPSGMSDADKTTHAAANFAAVLGHHFAFLHCWEIMKDEPKWQDPKSRSFAKSAGVDGFGEDTNLGEDNSCPAASAEKRPMGRDAAKKKAKLSGGSSSSSESAEKANACVLLDEEEAEEPISPPPTAKGKRTKMVRTKLSNFNPDEDVNLVKAWLEINCDPITNTGQKKDSMWLRILQRYNLRRGSYPERSLRSLQSRWEIIKAKVGKFSSFYADAIQENPSRMSDADKTTHAAANFAAVLGYHFAFLHCWEIMKDEPKWQVPKSRSFAKSAGVDGFGEDTNLGEDNSSPATSGEKRPMGRAAAKKKAKLSGGSSSSSESAEKANASALPDEEEAEEPISPPPTGKGKRTKMVRTKLSNFNPDEDVNLVKAWLEISCDPITNTGQKKDAMWLRILQRYNFRRGSYPERSLRSLQSRWDIIKAKVGKFSSFYADAIQENPSGMSNADKTTHAAANFAAVLGHNFAYLHCWEIMKDEPKWQDPKSRSFAKSAGVDGFGEDTNLGEDNSSPAASAEKRPMGRDAAKKKAKLSGGSSSSSENASRIQDLSLQKISILQEESVRKNDRSQQLACTDEKWFEEMRSHNQSLLHIEQEKIRMMREKHDMDRQEKEKQEDERIIGIDLDACTPAQRLYYQALQEEILEKIAARRRNRQGP